MTSTDLIPAALLARKAVVYVRQSTQSQVMTNLESQRRQYDLVDVARQRGFGDFEVIDDDLGRSASGTVARPGFDRLVALLCAGKVGAVWKRRKRYPTTRSGEAFVLQPLSPARTSPAVRRFALIVERSARLRGARHSASRD